MKRILPLLFIVFLSTKVTGQNFTGQWKGEFIDKSTSFTGWGGDRCEYVIEIECRGTKVSGYSYTYFSDGGKRYYTICKLTGTLNKASKFIEVKETERTKTNVPVNIRNCFQIHRLTYFQQGEDQTLEGNWVPVPNQQGDCGFGTTLLSRRVLNKTMAYQNNAKPKNQPKNTTPVVRSKPVTQPPAVAKKELPKAISPAIPDAEKLNPVNPEVTINDKPDEKINKLNETSPTKTETQVTRQTDPRYEKRNNDLIKTIEIDNASFTLDLYDNGEIDGDSISLFYNGKLLLSHKRLSDKAISLTLKIDDVREVNELIMYAENLGTIPPNTALMVVNDGDNRYEVRISSDLEKSGVIRFIHKPKKRQ